MTEFKDCIKTLRKVFPTLLPVRVYTKDLSSSGNLGLSILNKDDSGRPHHFTIYIHKSYKPLMLHMLAHEWAHVFSWQDGPYDNKEHPIEWGIALAKIYQELFDEEEFNGGD